MLVMAVVIEITIKAGGELLLVQEFGTIERAIKWLKRFEAIIEKED